MPHKSLVLGSLLLISQISFGYNNSTYIPKNFYKHADTLKREVDKFSPGFSAAFVASHFTNESCISLTHSRCWRSDVAFKTKWPNGRRREHGGGITMLTRTWYRSGRLRFDTLTRLTRKYRTHLKGLNWDTLISRPDLQLRAGIFLFMDDWNALPKTLSTYNHEAMISSSYNQGLGGLRRDRRICGLKANCDPNIWFGNVAKVKRGGRFSSKILYGRRTAYMINRHTVEKVMKIHYGKYERYFKDK